MSREKLMDKVIRVLGFESDWTIWFCQLCEDERMTQQMIELAFIEAMTKGTMEAEEEE